MLVWLSITVQQRFSFRGGACFQTPVSSDASFELVLSRGVFSFRHVCVILAERAIVRVSRVFYTKRKKVLKLSGRTSQCGVKGMVYANGSQRAEIGLCLIMLVQLEAHSMYSIGRARDPQSSSVGNF